MCVSVNCVTVPVRVCACVELCVCLCKCPVVVVQPIQVFRVFFFPFAKTKIANNPRANVLIIRACANLPKASLL